MSENVSPDDASKETFGYADFLKEVDEERSKAIEGSYNDAVDYVGRLVADSKFASDHPGHLNGDLPGLSFFTSPDSPPLPEDERVEVLARNREVLDRLYEKFGLEEGTRVVNTPTEKTLIREVVSLASNGVYFTETSYYDTKTDPQGLGVPVAYQVQVSNYALDHGVRS